MSARRLRLAQARLRAAATLLLDEANLGCGTKATRASLGRAALDAQDLADHLPSIARALEEHRAEVRRQHSEAA